MPFKVIELSCTWFVFKKIHVLSIMDYCFCTVAYIDVPTYTIYRERYKNHSKM